MTLVQEWEQWVQSQADTASVPRRVQVALASAWDCFSAVAYIKRVIKDKSGFPTLKFRALESLCSAMSTHHSVLAAAVVKKFLRRLVLFAQYRKELRSESRGATLFAGHSLSSAEETSASVAFLTCLLIALRIWPDLRVEEREKEAFKGAYQALLRAGVAFPKEPMLAIGQRDNSILEKHKDLLYGNKFIENRNC